MRRSLKHLPQDKQDQLATINNIIQQIAKKTIGVEMIILFGSYARGDQVNRDIVIHEGNTLEYKSDFDIMVITKKPVYEMQMRLAREIENKIRKDKSIDTPISIIVEDINHVNARLEENRYFYLDIKKEGIALYDSKKCALATARKLTTQEKVRMQVEDFNMWYNSGKNAIKIFKFSIQENMLRDAAFNLHQATEKFITAYLLVKTGYKPKTHDLEVLYLQIQDIDAIFTERFNLNDKKSKEFHCFELLRKAYVEARYSKSYAITTKELHYLEKKVTKLQKIIKKLCKVKESLKKA